MKIYKVGIRDNMREHQGYKYFARKSEAVKFFGTSDCKEDTDFEEIDLLINKEAIIQFLNTHCCHADNG